MVQLKSYLKVNDIRQFASDIVERLKEVVIANNGEYSGNVRNVKIRISSGKLARRFYDGMINIDWVRDTDDEWYLTPLGLDLGPDDFDDSITTSTTYILVNLDNIESLVLDFERLSLSAGISNRSHPCLWETRYITIEMKELSNLTSGDLKFIRQCHHDQLRIKYTPKDTDEDQLVLILQCSSKLKELRIGCLAERFLAVVNLVTSTRETISLRTLKMMDEGLVSFDWDGPRDNRVHIASTLNFSKGGRLFTMRTSFKSKGQKHANDDLVRDFIRQYGWTIENIGTAWVSNDHLASLLHDSIQRRESQIAVHDEYKTIDIEISSIRERALLNSLRNAVRKEGGIKASEL
ncbi:hypothetical protein BGZ65_012742 [Modicella reniformis]|uniref:Uncharacterized protein n=1 Tax=Modicella reniformis TaxID=1440133 RepID=A0A9P6M1A8_9FUNG|nr:hypothetical protein BGZ65_012742 [Modicella reniformis]